MENNKTRHVFENGYYLISNKAVAKCFLFKDNSDCDYFRNGIIKQLKDVCQILAFGFLHDEFQLVIKLRSKEEIFDHFKNTHDTEALNSIPEPTYIFSQLMANLQSGYVKKFNHKYGRDGGLMKSRYCRRLIESEGELDYEIERVNNLTPLFPRSSIWTFRRKQYKRRREIMNENRSSKIYYKLKANILDGIYTRNFKIKGFFYFKIDVYLRGDFENLPPKSLHPSKMKKLIPQIAFK